MKLPDKNTFDWQKIKDQTSSTILDVAKKTKKNTQKIISPSKSIITTPRFRRIFYTILALIVAYLIIAISFAPKVYKFQTPNKISTFVETIVPYPAAIVGHRTVALSRVKSDVKLVEYFINTTKTTDRYEGINIPNNLYNRAIEATLIDEIAQKNNIAVSDKEVEDAWQNILVEEEGFGDVDMILKEFHNTSSKHLKLFIKETLLREKVEEKLPKRRKVSHILVVFDKNDENSKNKARAKIEKIKKDIETGTKFSDSAKEHSEDAKSRDNGGDLSWVDVAFQLEGQDEVAFRDAIFKTKIGQSSDIIETHLGYHLVMPTEEKGSLDKSMSQIIEEARSQTKIIRFLKFKKQ